MGDGDETDDVERLRTAAAAGDTEAATELGTLLVRADRVAEGEAWLRRAAEAGDPDALSLVGLALLDDGRPDEAEEWLRRAAAAGHTRSAARLGALLQVTHTSPERTAEAERLLRDAAERADRYAMTALGVLLLARGDAAEADDWLVRSRTPAGDGSASRKPRGAGADTAAGLPHFSPGEARRLGPAALLREFAATAEAFGHHQAAANWLRLAAAGGDPEAMHGFGLFLYGHRRYRSAEPWMRRAAASGRVPAALGGLGLTLLRLDRREEGERWLAEGARLGDPEAMHGYGLLLGESGRPRQAHKWLKRWEKAARKTG